MRLYHTLSHKNKLLNDKIYKKDMIILPLLSIPKWANYLSPLLLTKLNSLRPRQNRRHFTDDVFKCNFLNENVWIPIKISLKFVPQGPINNIPALVQLMAWRRSGDKPLSDPMMISLLTHICVTRPQWVILRHTQPKICYVITHPCHKFNGGWAKLSLNLGHGWVITSHQSTWL